MTNRFKILTSLLVFVFIGNLSNPLYGQTDPVAILKKLDATLAKVKDKTVDMEMILLNIKSNKKKVKKAILMQKGMDKKLFRYVAPKSDSGIATLSLPNKEIYLYLPMFKKPKKITNLAESKALNKSDFSIEDMSVQSYEDKYKGKLQSADGESYVIALTDKSGDAEYKNQVITINKKNYYPEKMEFYDDNFKLVRVQLWHHKQVNGLWVADEISMEDLNKKHKTTIKMSGFKINQGLSDELFKPENLAPIKD